MVVADGMGWRSLVGSAVVFSSLVALWQGQTLSAFSRGFALHRFFLALRYDEVYSVLKEKP